MNVVTRDAVTDKNLILIIPFHISLSKYCFAELSLRAGHIQTLSKHQRFLCMYHAYMSPASLVMFSEPVLQMLISIRDCRKC